MAEANIIAALRDLGRTIEQSTGNTYAQAGFRIVEDIKQGMRQSQMNQRTGDLYRSVGFVLQGDSLVLSMKDYGFYQNFGVLGVNNNPGVNPVEFGLKPKSGDKYAFTEDSIEKAKETAAANGGRLPGFIVENMRFGIRAKNFLHPEQWEDILAEEFLTGQIVAVVENTFTNSYII